MGLQLIWQCGSLYYEQYEKYQSDLVKIISFVSDMDQLYAAQILSYQDLVLQHSELCCVARPVLLVPSPNVAENHQYHNAKALEDQGAALVISEKNLEHDFDFF